MPPHLFQVRSFLLSERIEIFDFEEGDMVNENWSSGAEGLEKDRNAETEHAGNDTGTTPTPQLRNLFAVLSPT